MTETLLHQKYRGYLVDIAETWSSESPDTKHFSFVVQTQDGETITPLHTGLRSNVEYAYKAAKEWIDARVIADSRSQAEDHYTALGRGYAAASAAEREYDASQAAGYRKSAKPPSPPERYGFLKCPQYAPTPKHTCSPPGFFERLFLPVSEGDMWRCQACGKCFMWLYNGEAFFRSWVRADDVAWRQACRSKTDAGPDSE